MNKEKAAEAILGLYLVLGGLAGEIATGGTATPIAIPAAGLGAALLLHAFGARK